MSKEIRFFVVQTAAEKSLVGLGTWIRKESIQVFVAEGEIQATQVHYVKISIAMYLRIGPPT